MPGYATHLGKPAPLASFFAGVGKKPPGRVWGPTSLGGEKLLRLLGPAWDRLGPPLGTHLKIAWDRDPPPFWAGPGCPAQKPERLTGSSKALPMLLGPPKTHAERFSSWTTGWISTHRSLALRISAPFRPRPLLPPRVFAGLGRPDP